MNNLTDHIINKKSDRIPVWFMRQAGRYLPEFREIRKKNQDFIKLCLNSKLVKEITIQPIKRFDLDAAIIFSDILMVPYGLGQNVKFVKGEGPILNNLDIQSINQIESNEFKKKMEPVYNSIKEVKKTIKDKTCIGFVGAPWTLLIYMLNKKSPKQDINLNTILKDKSLVNHLLKKIEHFVCLHIEEQVKAGADVIQVFDSWAGLIPEKDLDMYCFKPNFTVANYTKSLKVPVICFPRGIGQHYSNFCKSVKPHCISIDYTVKPEWAKKNLRDVTIQGGLDPKTLLETREVLEKEVSNYINVFKDHPYIFNLGHGVLPQTKPETVEHIVKFVREKSA